MGWAHRISDHTGGQAVEVVGGKAAYCCDVYGPRGACSCRVLFSRCQAQHAGRYTERLRIIAGHTEDQTGGWTDAKAVCYRIHRKVQGLRFAYSRLLLRRRDHTHSSWVDFSGLRDSRSAVES